MLSQTVRLTWIVMMAVAVPASAALHRPVQTTNGELQGIPGKNPSVIVFRGVPYAAPPIGNFRWKAPQPVHSWAGIRRAGTFGNICVQNALKPGSFYQVEFYESPEPMSEDCLYLNVWTAASSASEKRPVMVWLHGGGFVEGSGSLPSFNGESSGQQGRCAGNHQLPSWRLRLSRSSGAHCGGSCSTPPATTACSISWKR